MWIALRVYSKETFNGGEPYFQQCSRYADENELATGGETERVEHGKSGECRRSFGRGGIWCSCGSGEGERIELLQKKQRRLIWLLNRRDNLLKPQGMLLVRNWIPFPSECKVEKVYTA